MRSGLGHDEQERFYVGTTLDKAERASVRGLARSFDFTHTYAAAYDHAVAKARRRGGVPAIIQIDPDRANLRVAEFAWWNPPNLSMLDWKIPNRNAWKLSIDEGEIPSPKDPNDWRTSLDIVHWASHEGVLPPERIMAVYPVGPEI